MSARHPQLLDAADAVVVAIDLQEPFLRGAVESEALVRRVELLIRGAAILDLPVLATLQYGERMGPLIPSIRQALPPAVTAIDKCCFSAAASELFLRELTSSGRRQVVLCGVETHICVCQTALDLIHAGWQVHVPFDAVSGRGEPAHRAGIERMRAAGAVITSVESALYEMLFEAGGTAFKRILPLVKEA